MALPKPQVDGALSMAYGEERARVLLAVAVLLIFALTFTPLPIQVFTGETPAPNLGQEAGLPAVPMRVVGFAIWSAWRMRAKHSPGLPRIPGRNRREA